MSFHRELAQESGQSAHFVETQTVWHQVIESDELPLFVSIIFMNHSFRAKPDPLDEVIELFALVCRGVNRRS